MQNKRIFFFKYIKWIKLNFIYYSYDISFYKKCQISFGIYLMILYNTFKKIDLKNFEYLEESSSYISILFQ